MGTAKTGNQTERSLKKYNRISKNCGATTNGVTCILWGCQKGNQERKEKKFKKNINNAENFLKYCQTTKP